MLEMVRKETANKTKISASCCYLCYNLLLSWIPFAVLITSSLTGYLRPRKKGRENRDKDDQRLDIKDEHKIIKDSKGWIRNICSQLLTTKDQKGNQIKYSNTVYYMHNNILFHAMCSCGTHRFWITTEKYKCISSSLWLQSLLSGNLYCAFLAVAKLCSRSFPCLIVLCLNSLNVYQRMYQTETLRQMNPLPKSK